MERNRIRNNSPSTYIAEVIGKNYSRLRKLCKCRKNGLFTSRSYEDIFEDTILYVIHDPEAHNITTEDSIIEHFCYRYRMIEFQTVMDSRQLKEIPYAEYLQAQKETTEE